MTACRCGRLTFWHCLRSSRRFVFENIMDLEHGYMLYRRWVVRLTCHDGCFYGSTDASALSTAPP
jgi:hypothetical protein